MALYKNLSLILISSPYDLKWCGKFEIRNFFGFGVVQKGQFSYIELKFTRIMHDSTTRYISNSIGIVVEQSTVVNSKNRGKYDEFVLTLGLDG